MNIDLCGILYARLKEAGGRYKTAMAKNDRGGIKKFAQICANMEKQQAQNVPDQMKAPLDKAAGCPCVELQKKTQKTGPLSMEDFTKSIERVKSPLISDDLKLHEVWSRQFGAT